MPRRQDRRVQRTHQLLRTALVSLIQEQGFEAISVRDIVDRANVGRATFYAHFGNKEELLASGFEDLKLALNKVQRAALTRSGGPRVLAFSRDIFQHVYEYRNVFRAVAGKRSGALVQQMLYKVMLDLIREDLKTVASRRTHASIASEAQAQFIAGALSGLLIWWLTARTPLSVDAVNDVFRRLAVPAMETNIRC